MNIASTVPFPGVNPNCILFKLTSVCIRLPSTLSTIFMACSSSFTFLYEPQLILYRCDGVLVKASVLQSVDLGFISKVEPYQKTLKNGIHSFPAWRSANWDCVNRSRQVRLCSWARHLTGRLHLYVADRWWGQAVCPSWSPSLTEDLQTERER